MILRNHVNRQYRLQMYSRTP